MPPPQYHSDRVLRRLSARDLRSHPAFTLVELLAVMSIMILLVTLATPAIRGVMSGRSINSSVNNTWSTVSTARQQAISRRAYIALVFASNRQSADPDKSDALMLLAAQPVIATDGATSWKWATISPWLKLPHGVSVAAGVSSGGSTTGFYSPSSTPAPLTSCSQITAALPKLEGDTIAADKYLFVVFRPDGSVMSSTTTPFFAFTKLRSKSTAKEAAIVLSPDSGRARLVRY